MKRISFLSFILTFLFTQSSFAQTVPVTKKGAKVFNEHGQQRVDDYYWMNNPSDSNVINHLKEENAYTEAYMKHTEDLQNKLYNEIIARIPGKDESLPTKRNGYWYYSRFEDGKQYPYYLRRKETMTAPEEVFLDIPELAKPYKTYIIRGWSISKDNMNVAYGADMAGDRRSTLFIKNLCITKIIS